VYELPRISRGRFTGKVGFRRGRGFAFTLSFGWEGVYFWVDIIIWKDGSCILAHILLPLF